jgi:diadenosine tetraphosphate (Ap4A) HIT family hydrolase
MRRPDCFLCGDLADREGRVALDAGLALTSDIAPLGPGHLLIHTQEHVTSFAVAEPNTLERWKVAIRRVLGHPALEGRPVLLFEHGTDGLEPVEAGCTDHAHIHVMPLRVDSTGRPDTSAGQAVAQLRDCSVGPTLCFEDLGRLAGTSYFWLADRDLILRTVVPDRVERQLLRRIVAEAVGLERHRTWDLFDDDAARETMASWRQYVPSASDIAGSLG